MPLDQHLEQNKQNLVSITSTVVLIKKLWQCRRGNYKFENWLKLSFTPKTLMERVLDFKVQLGFNSSIISNPGQSAAQSGQIGHNCTARGGAPHYRLG